MKWIEARIYTTTAGIEIITGFLMSYGIRESVIEDSADFERFLSDTEIHWDYVDESLDRLKTCETCVKFYVPDTTQGAETLREVKSAVASLRDTVPNIELGRLKIVLADINEEDWATAWKKYYHTFTVADTLSVVPSWESAEGTGTTVLKIDPGMAFGTGTHNSTHLCLTATCELSRSGGISGKSVLDLGCGSGILSIAALLLGAKSALAVDIDEMATKVSCENATLNGISHDTFRTLTGNAISNTALMHSLESESYDIIFANIVADVIIAYAPLIAKVLSQDGTVISSGIIEERESEVISVFKENGFKNIKIMHSGGWTALVLRRN